MFGYILNPDIVSHNWRITYEDFTKEAEEVTKTLVENTAVFPAKLKLADIQKMTMMVMPLLRKSRI